MTSLVIVPLPGITSFPSLSSGHGNDDVGCIVVDVGIVVLVVVGIGTDSVQVVVVVIHVVVHIHN